MLDNELNSILDEIASGSSKGVAEDQSKYKTSDFSLDSILKEYGIIDEPKKAVPKKKEAVSAPVEKKEEPAPVMPSTAVVPEVPIVKETPVKTVEIIEKEKSEIKASSDIEISVVEQPSPKAPVINIATVEEKAIEKELVSEKKTEDNVDANKVTSPKKEDKKVDIFDNQDIVSMLAANKLGKTNEKGESTDKKEITQLFSAEQEEDFKMRSGYIDIEAIRAATAAIKFEKTAEDISTENDAKINTDQKILFGKIGSFFADTTFKYDTSTVNDLVLKDKKKKNKTVKNEDTSITEETVKEEPIADGDILEAADVPNVEQEMLSQINISILKAVLTGILAIPLVILNLFPALVENMLPSLSMVNPFNYATANLSILLIIAIININIVFKGMVGLFSLKPTGSTLASLSVIASVIHCVYTMLNPEQVTAMYGIVSALAVIFVLIGKYIYYRNVYKNFEILAFNAPKTACVKIAGGHSLKELYSDTHRAVSCRPVTLLTHFLTNSFDYNFADKLANYSILSVILLAVAACVYSVFSNTSTGIFTVIASAFAILCPFCFDMSYSLPLNTSSNKIRKTGSAVVSYTTAKEFADTTELVMCDSDLFKPENISVHSMKINGNEKINDVIINCASLIKASNSPVSGAFLNILDNKDSMLMPVTDFDWAPNKGYSGNINGTKYFIGSSQYLADCGIKLPTIDLEEKYKRIGRQVVMFADSRKLLAVFSISYNRDEVIYNNLHKVSLDATKILVLTKDCNITSELLTNIYEVSENTFAIASKEEYERVYHNEESMEKTPAGIYSITGSGGITSALTNCKRLLSTVKVSVIFRTVALVACLALLVYACITNNVETLLSAKNIILFHLIWIVPSLFVSVFAG